MALHDENTHDIGAAIAGQPEDPNVGKWKEFLTRPENLATALVLLAGVTSPKAQGQTNLNKALTSGVGALGFRGGLESGVKAQRAALRAEDRTVQQQDADLAVQEAAAAVSQGQLAVNQGGLAVEQQRVTQAGQPRPLPPSTINLQNAQATALGLDPNAVPKDFDSLFAQNKQIFAENNIGTEVPIAQIALQTTQELLLRQLAAAGKITADGIDVTPAQAAILGVEIPDVPGPTEPGDTTPAATPSTKEASAARKSLRVSGRFISANPGAQTITLNELRRAGNFDDSDSDETILDALEQARTLAQNKELLQTTDLEELKEMQTIFGKSLSAKEKTNVRRAINARLGLPGSQRLLDESP